MQQKSTRRTNRERTEATRLALLAAARALFVEKGYADTGTPEIVAAAKVTRGALYHHFADKADLFRCVAIDEARAVAAQIERETEQADAGLESLMAGADAYFAAMAVAGRTRLLLVDGPAVLGHPEMARIDMETGGEELRQGLVHALSGLAVTGAPLDALAHVVSAAFDRAALAIAEGEPAEDYKAAVRLILDGLLRTA